MAQMSGGKAVVESLEAEGTKHVFGLIGSAGMEIFDALYDAKSIRFIGVRDERTGVHMADGYARASRRRRRLPRRTERSRRDQPRDRPRAGARGLLAGGGARRLAVVARTSIATRSRKSTSRRSSSRSPRRPGPLTQAARIPEMMREAFRTALAPRRGPVLLNLPRDLLAEVAEIEPTRRAPPAIARRRAAVGDPELVAQAARLLAGAKRPLIIAGGGIKNRRHPRRRRWRSPSNSTRRWRCRPATATRSPATHPLYAGQVGPRGNAGRLATWRRRPT